ncbi:hypothetical protein CQW23_12539 [Capsicum baccatum]|uniref:Uncharacterized protein n=1 Tax=Capsicum baccatum TaxID=33114 RepID=A0A2G2WT16_CAPBA|nr:hypothetical protein CQW23_12539 [Capsicum baccatum]
MTDMSELVSSEVGCLIVIDGDIKKVKNNEKARKSATVGESEQDPSQAASTSTIISTGKLKSFIRCWPWILDDHVDHIEEDSGCETDKKNTMASAIVVVTELPVTGRRWLISVELVEKEEEVSNLMILRYRNATELELVVPYSMYHGH